MCLQGDLNKLSPFWPALFLLSSTWTDGGGGELPHDLKDSDRIEFEMLGWKENEFTFLDP